MVGVDEESLVAVESVLFVFSEGVDAELVTVSLVVAFELEEVVVSLV